MWTYWKETRQLDQMQVSTKLGEMGFLKLFTLSLTFRLELVFPYQVIARLRMSP